MQSGCPSRPLPISLRLPWHRRNMTWPRDVYKRQQQRQRVVMVVVGGFCVLLLAGYLLFVLKPDSAPVSYTHLDVYKRQVIQFIILK